MKRHNKQITKKNRRFGGTDDTDADYNISNNENERGSDFIITADKYDDELKVQALYSVLHDYARILRPGVYSTDTQLIFLFTMCRLIDRSREVNDDNDDDNDDDDNGDGPSGDRSDDGDHNASIDSDSSNSGHSVNFDNTVWHLDRLQRDFDTVFEVANTAATPGLLTASQRLRILEDLVIDVENRYI